MREIVPRRVTEAIRGRRRRLPGGSIDQPPNGLAVSRGPCEVAGWALLPSTQVSRVELSLDGAPAGRARTAQPRADLAAISDEPAAPLSGFEATLDLSSLPGDKGELRIGATAVGLDGSRRDLQPVHVALAPAESPYSDPDGRAGELRRRVRDAFPPESGGRSKSIHLLAFSHDLGYGGAQLYLAELLQRLAKKGVACSVVAGSDGPLREQLEESGVPVHVTTGFPVGTPDEYEGKIHDLVAWAHPQRFNVTLTNTMYTFHGLDVAARLGIPGVFASHEFYDLPEIWMHYYGNRCHPYARATAEKLIGGAAAVIFESDASRRLYARYGEASRFVTLPYGIESERIAAHRDREDEAVLRQVLDIPLDATVLLSMGEICPRKGQTALAQAFSAVANDHPKAFLVMVGESGFQPAYVDGLRQFLQRTGLQSRTMITTVTPDPYPWYQVADVAVCPSDLESLPKTVLESMVFERPVLATSVFGLPELIDDGRTGYLCEPRDLNALTEGLDRVLRARQDERDAVAAAGAALVRERHDPERYAQTVQDLLGALAEDPDAHPRDIVEI